MTIMHFSAKNTFICLKWFRCLSLVQLEYLTCLSRKQHLRQESQATPQRIQGTAIQSLSQSFLSLKIIYSLQKVRMLFDPVRFCCKGFWEDLNIFYDGSLTCFTLETVIRHLRVVEWVALIRFLFGMCHTLDSAFLF